MATVYSLICFGGRTGKTVALSIASPCVASLTNHGLRDGAGIVLSSSGALPTGITAGVTYYVKSTGDGTFNLYDTSANAISGGATGRINTSGSQSGTHTVKSKKMIDLFAAYSGRWGSSGSERCYDGIASWIAGRSSASEFDSEVGEVGESFSDYITSRQEFTIPSASTTLTTMLAGSRSAGFHGGNFPVSRTLTSGYEILMTGGSGAAIRLTRARCHVEGLIIRQTVDASSIEVGQLGGLGSVKNCIHIGESWSNYGLYSEANYFTFERNIVHGGRAYGLWLYDWVITTASGNLVTGCSDGVRSGSSPRGYVYNNISIGNTTNWNVNTTYLAAASNNAGLSGEAPIVGSGTRLTVATTDFSNFAGKNFRPANASSPQVETGAFFYGAQESDIAGRFCPDYMNGAAAYFDVGPYEYDHGYGPWPASTTATFSGINAGSEIRVYDTSANELAGIETCAADQALTWAIPSPATVRIVIVHPNFKIKEFTYTAQAGNQSIPVQQEADKWYSNPA